MQFRNRGNFTFIFAIKFLKCCATKLLITRAKHRIERTGIIGQPVNAYASTLSL